MLLEPYSENNIPEQTLHLHLNASFPGCPVTVHVMYSLSTAECDVTSKLSRSMRCHWGVTNATINLWFKFYCNNGGGATMYMCTLCTMPHKVRYTVCIHYCGKCSQTKGMLLLHYIYIYHTYNEFQPAHMCLHIYKVKKIMCVKGHMLKKIRIGWWEIIFFNF